MSALKTTARPDIASPQTGIPPEPGLKAAMSRLVAAQALRLPLLAPIGLAAGAAAYLTASNEPQWPLLLLAALIALMGVVWARARGRQVLFWAFLFTLTTAVGAITAKFRSHVVAAPVLIQEGGPARIEGRLVEIDANDRNRRLRIEVSAIEGLARENTPRYVRFSYRYPIDFSPGRTLACTAILSPPPAPTIHGDYAFHRDAWFSQLGAVGFAVGRCTPIFAATPSNPAQWFEYRIAAVRRAISEHVVSVTSQPGAPFAAAMVTGDRSHIPPEDVEALRGSGLAHLLAISGLHMALAGGAFFIGLRLVWPLTGPIALRVPAIKVAAVGAIIGCTVYFLLSGGSIATQRAFIMAMIAFGAKIIDKPALSLRSLAIAFGIIVLLHPEAVVTPGFQMSFAASAALIGTFEAWPVRTSSKTKGSKNRVLNWATGALSTSVTASLATMPFAIHHFDRAAPLGILANLAITPIISFWSAPSAAGALIASVVGLQDPFLASLAASLEQVLRVAHIASDYAPNAAFPPITPFVLVAFAAAIAAYSLMAGSGRLFCLPPLILALASWAQTERPVAYVASNAVIYVKAAAGWSALRHWQTKETLPPLMLDGPITDIACPDGTAGCTLEFEFGSIEIHQPKTGYRASDSPAHPAPIHCGEGFPAFRLYQKGVKTALNLHACDIQNGGSAQIYLGDNGPTMIQQSMRNERPWSPRRPTTAQ